MLAFTFLLLFLFLLHRLRSTSAGLVSSLSSRVSVSIPWRKTLRVESLTTMTDQMYPPCFAANLPLRTLKLPRQKASRDGEERDGSLMRSLGRWHRAHRTSRGPEHFSTDLQKNVASLGERKYRVCEDEGDARKRKGFRWVLGTRLDSVVGVTERGALRPAV